LRRDQRGQLVRLQPITWIAFLNNLFQLPFAKRIGQAAFIVEPLRKLLDGSLASNSLGLI
jgi:hypothetical protein